MRRYLLFLAPLLVKACVGDAPQPVPDGGGDAGADAIPDAHGADAIPDAQGADASPSDGGDGGACASGSGAYQWHFGASTSDVGGAAGAATDAQGNVYVVGNYVNTPALGTAMLPLAVGGYDVYVLKLAPSGQVLWAQSIGSNGNDFASGIAVDGGDVYVTGWVANGMMLRVADVANALALGGAPKAWLAKLSAATGNHVWTRAASIASGELRSTGVGAKNGRVAFAWYAGQTGSVTVDGQGLASADSKRDAGVAAFDADGKMLFARRIGGPASGTGGDDEARGIAVADSGEIALSFVSTSSPLAFVGPGGSPNSTISRASQSAGPRNAHLVRIDPSGALSQQFVVGNATIMGNDAAGGPVAFAPSGDLYWGGLVRGSNTLGATNLVAAAGTGPCGINASGLCEDAFLVKLQKGTGSVLWAKLVGGSQDESMTALVADACGVVAAGLNRSAALKIEGQPVESPSVNVMASGPWAMFAVRYSAEGALAWAKGLAPSSANDAVSPAGIALGPAGEVRMGLGVQGDVKLDGTNVYSAGSAGLRLVVWGLDR